VNVGSNISSIFLQNSLLQKKEGNFTLKFAEFPVA